MRTKIVAGNWKMNTVVSEGKELVDGILSKLSTIQSLMSPFLLHLFLSHLSPTNYILYLASLSPVSEI